MDRSEVLKKIELLDDYLHIKEFLKYIVDNRKKFDNEILYNAMAKAESISEDFKKEIFYEDFYKNTLERYNQYINSKMILLESQTFMMGSSKDSDQLYCGEIPKHEVFIDEFEISSFVVDAELYNSFCGKKTEEVSSHMPAVDVSWYDAVMFSRWIGCRLPTEAEWELASGKLENSHWCCKEDELDRYAWYSENSQGCVHEIAKKAPNKYGLFDMLGNIWEWVMDSYDSAYYANSAKKNPVCNKITPYKSCRGGSIHAFSEMCRSEFRYNEPAYYRSSDLGFRVVRDNKFL